MELIQKRIVLPSSSSILTMFGIWDIHCASKGCDIGKLKKCVTRIGDTDNSVWINGGDNGESIPKSDRRFDQDNLRPEYAANINRLGQMEADELVDIFNPIRDKLIGCLEGNHEDAYRKRFNMDMTWELCKRLNVPHLSSMALIRLTVTWGKDGHTSNIDILAMHGYGGGRKWGGKLQKISDIASGIKADIYMMGHLHSQAAIKEVELSLPIKGELKLLEKERLGILVPSFYRTYAEGVDSYASKMCYSPSVLGMSKTEISLETEKGVHKVRLTTMI